MKYQVIVADPAWATNDKLTMSAVKRGAAANYSTMSLDNLCALPIKNLADPEGCILGLWVLGSMLEEGMRVMKAWGFQQKQIYVWVKTKKEPFAPIVDRAIRLAKLASEIPIKTRKKDALLSILKECKEMSLLAFGMGRLFRQTHEVCLIGINTTQVYKKLKNKSQRSVCFAENKGHSIKPDALQDQLNIMFPNAKKLEMFARRQRIDGWTCIGNEINNEDISISIQKLIDAK